MIRASVLENILPTYYDVCLTRTSQPDSLMTRASYRLAPRAQSPLVAFSDETSLLQASVGRFHHGKYSVSVDIYCIVPLVDLIMTYFSSQSNIKIIYVTNKQPTIHVPKHATLDILDYNNPFNHTLCETLKKHTIINYIHKKNK